MDVLKLYPQTVSSEIIYGNSYTVGLAPEDILNVDEDVFVFIFKGSSPAGAFSFCVRDG